MGKKRKGHHLNSVHVNLDDDFYILDERTARVSTARQEDEDRRVAQRREELKVLRNELHDKIAENSVLMDAPGGLEYSEDLAADVDLYHWTEEQLNADENENFIVIDDDGDDQFEDITEHLSGSKGYYAPEHHGKLKHSRTEQENKHWESLYDDLYSAFLAWEAYGPPNATESYTGNDLEERARPAPEYHEPITCLYMHERRDISFIRDQSTPLSVTMVRHGFMPTSPFHPGLGIDIRVLDIYHAVCRRCPNLGIQPFVHSICDLHQVSFRATHARMFSRAYDAYMEIHHRLNSALDQLLYATPLHQYQQMCPCCTRKLPDEHDLTFQMLIAVDGNESLKRQQMQRRLLDSSGRQTGVVNIEQEDSRNRGSLFFVEASCVDQYKDEVRKRKWTSTIDHGTKNRVSDDHSAEVLAEGYPTDGLREQTPCTERWTNLSEDSKKKMWGVFDETGIFIATCRHGVVLLMCDMIKSGELAKYPLGLTSKLIDLFGENLMIGYDIGCGFSATARNSILVGPKVTEKNCRFCCGSFHGHAHERVCQLRWHPLHINGTGIEDFEGCERVFSESNRVAGVTRHASKFHRRQAILRHFERWNEDKYAELSRFLTNNYRQSLRNISELSAKLEKTLLDLNIDSPADVFPKWREEELSYLMESQSRQPKARERIELEYLEVLKKLASAESTYETNTLQWVSQRPQASFEGNSSYSEDARETRRMESAMRGLDSILTLQSTARKLETNLGIQIRWTPDSAEWKRVDKSWQEREFDKAVDRLEGLVLARIFELEKMNQAGTCYKLRTQISKALKARSTAISSAIKSYNEAAMRLSRPVLMLDQVLKYVFVGEFDILRMSRFDITSKRWARRAEREAAVDFFKLERSKEEIKRLNIEVRRLYVHILDSEAKVQEIVVELETSDPRLAIQMKKRQKLLHSINKIHWRRLKALQGLEGFSGERDPLKVYTPSGEKTARCEVFESAFHGFAGSQLEERDVGNVDEAQEDVLIRADTQLENLIALSSAVDSLSVSE